MIKIVIMNSCKLLFIYIMVERILQVKINLSALHLYHLQQLVMNTYQNQKS